MDSRQLRQASFDCDAVGQQQQQQQQQQLEHEQSEKLNAQKQQEQYRQLQRDLADAISRLAPLDDIRILLASGAKPNQPVVQGLHPIHYAVYQNFVAAARLLILRGCDVNAMDDNGYSPVHLCAERGYYQLLEFLIQNNARVCFVDVREQNFNSSLADEPLSLALKKGHLDCGELLLKNGADPNARYFLGAEINRVNILKVGAIKLLLKYGAQPDSRDRSGLSPLMRAARNPLGYATVKVLIDYGADVNDIASEKHDYRTILHHSIFSGNLELIRLILSSGAKYPILNFDKPSPLDIAIISGSAEIVKLLIEFGANVNHGAKSIGLPLSVALTQQIKNKLIIVRLLLEGGANPNSVCVSLTRVHGPPVLDYLNSLASQTSGGGGGGGSHSRRQQPPSGQQSQRQEQVEIVRLLVSHGARILLVQQSASGQLLGLARTLLRLQDELSLELLHMLVDSAEQVNWKLLSRVVYNCLRLTLARDANNNNRHFANQLNDPSYSDNITPQLLIELVGQVHDYDKLLLQAIVEQMQFGGFDDDKFSVLKLKQLARIEIQRHLVEKNLRGKALVKRLGQLPVPTSVKNYLLYQNYSPNLFSKNTNAQN